MKRFILFLLMSGYCFASNYYVSNRGNDDNPGTINSPFKTIQKAADVVVGGDVVNLLEGLYHEEVTLNNTSGSEVEPIIFQSFDDDRVVIDGTRPITTVWINHQENIWKTELDFDIWQLFLDRKEQVMARWPNANFSDGSVWDKENHWAHGTMDQSQEPAYENGTLIDEPHGNVDLASIGFSVVGAIAILNVGSFRTWTRKINTHSGSIITYDPVPENEWKVKHHDYYLEGKLEFLDSEGEWFFDHEDKILYFWTPQGQNPNSLSIRGKVQSYAFSIANSDYVEIRGLEFFGTTFHFDNSDNSIVENCNLWYPSCHKRMLGVTDTQPEMSVFRNSSFCTVSKSAFRYTDGSALEMYSHNNTIEDCYFYHIDYSVTDLNSLMTTIQMGGANNVIRRNTMHKLGASATLNPGDAGLITLNNISDTGHMQGDGAMVQVMTGQSPGTEISYNWLHSSVKYGARFDGNGTGNNGIMHHNVFWGLDNAGIMAKGFEFKIYNNTVLYGPDNKNDILIMIAQGGNEGTETYNNVANKISGHRSGSFEDYPVPGIYSNNVNGYEIGRSIEQLFIAPENLDFRPHPDSMLVDAGIIISGYTDGYVGNAPDIGAYEYGAEMWVPGITWNLSQEFEDEFIEPVIVPNPDDPDSPNQNNPPVASSFVSSIVEDVYSSIDLLSQDADNDPISYTILDGPFHGELVFSSDESISYSPYNNFFGLDSFTYVAYDGTDYSEPATVNIEVSEVNDKPVAMDNHFVIEEDDTLHTNLFAEDGDHFLLYINMQDLTYSITSNVLNGTLSVIDTSGAFTYTPNSNFFGADSFQFSATDNGTTAGVDDFLADTAMIHLFVEPINDAPVLSAFVDTLMHEDSTLILTVFASDIDNGELNVYAYSLQERVSVLVEDTLLHIIPDSDWNGTAEIVVVANDDISRASDVKEFTVEVAPVNDPPFFTMEHYHAMGDMTTGLEHWLYADDIDSDIFFTLEGAPSWISLDGSNMIGQPEQDGEYLFTVSVSDSEYVVSEQFTVHIADHRPEVLSLEDVPNDQGKQMRIVWKPGQVDPSLPFTHFSTWRKVDLEPDTFYFTKENNSDWTLEENQDRISETVWLTRGNNQGLFNIFYQDSYAPDGPMGTSWRWGPTQDENYSDLDYTSWNAAVLQSGYNVNQTLVQQVAGVPVFSLFLNETQEYYDVTFTSFSGNNTGGGFSWYRTPVESQPDTSNLWDLIASVPWNSTQDEYSMVVPTLGDSTSYGIYSSTFRVKAHTENVELNHVSEPVTGFSIDNLPPIVPQGLTALQSGSSIILQWTAQIDLDFSYHNIYRNDLSSLTPAMVFTTTDSFYVDQDGTNGSYEYWITAVDSGGNESDASDIVAVVLSLSEQTAVPTVFALEQNYPNPFNPSTQIRYALPEATSVTVTVYDIMGRKIRILVQDNQVAGYYTALWNATNDRGLPVSAGMYIYMLQAGDYHEIKKMILLK